MKFTLSWLKEYLDTDKNVYEIAEKLTAIGVEVEDVIDRAKAFDGFVVGFVKDAKQHPDADRLQVCTVDTGDGSDKQIVCGAPNARAGIKVAFAPVGAYIPGIDVTLKNAKIRGVESAGMMCSERELELSDEHNGIIELPEDAEIGAPLAPVLGLDDPIIDIAVTPNRGDTAGIYGLARELAAAGYGTMKELDTSKVEPKFDTSISVTIHDEKACPLFLGRLIKGVKNGPSPKWLQDQLRAIGLRPISILVDITNYFCIGLNRPLHVYDADQLQGNIHVKMSKGGEELSALNDKEYTLTPNMTVITDDKEVLGLGGIVGGTKTGSEFETTNVFLEAAYFDPITTAMTGRALQLDSDARYRFERGIDPAFTRAGIELATKMILDLCGGEAGSVVEAGSVPDISTTYQFDTDMTTRLGGLEVEEKRQIEILESLGFICKKSGDVYSVTSPSWRHDLQGSADFVEEVLRIVGYDQIPSLSVTKNHEIDDEHVLDPFQTFAARAKRMLTARGLFETVTWSFVDEKAANAFRLDDIRDEDFKALTLTNPISEDLKYMRPSILPNLINAAAKNKARGFGGTNLMEVGPVFRNIELVKGQMNVVTGLRTGDTSEKHWTGSHRNVDLMDVKADVMALLGLTGSNLNPQITTDAPSYYHPGRSAVLRLGKNVLGYFGELHPGLLEEMDFEGPAVAFELFYESLPLKHSKSDKKKLLQASNLQPLSRDFAFILKDDVSAADTLRAIIGTDKNLIANAEVFDVYQGKGVEEGHKSVAINVTLQPSDKTLTDEEIEAVSKKIIESVEARVGGKLR